MLSNGCENIDNRLFFSRYSNFSGNLLQHSFYNSLTKPFVGHSYIIGSNDSMFDNYLLSFTQFRLVSTYLNKPPDTIHHTDQTNLINATFVHVKMVNVTCHRCVTLSWPVKSTVLDNCPVNKYLAWSCLSAPLAFGSYCFHNQTAAACFSCSFKLEYSFTVKIDVRFIINKFVNINLI